MTLDRRGFTRALLALLAAPAASCARSAPSSSSPHRELYLLETADRTERLLAGAKQEGVVSLYTSLNTQDSGPLTAAFEKKYGIRTALWRSSSERVIQRAISEARARRFAADVFETNGPEMEALHREGVLEEFRSPHFADLPEPAFPPHRHWVADRFNFFTIGYNTNLVPPDEVPGSYEDLVHPRFAGRIGLEASDWGWFGAMVRHMGEEQGLAYFRRLAAARPQVRSGHTLLGQLLASGEIPLVASLYNHNVERVVVQGAPVRWKALEPTFAQPNAIGLARQAPHPHAAMLFADFVLSREGQELLKQRNRVPASRAVDSHLNDFPFQIIDPTIVLDEDDKWSKLWSDLFLRGQAVPRESDA